MDLLVPLLLGVLAIAASTAVGRRLGVASPLILLGIGIAVGYLPFVHMPPVDPEWILVGVLPPLLYSAAVNLPAVEFRRDLRPIVGLSLVLVVISSLVLGLFFAAVVPGLGLPIGIALGAILSPTDAVATTIAKRLGIAPRVITMLEGESLLNDATALVLLRTAIAAIAGAFHFGETFWTFVWSVVIAVVIGAIVGWLTLLLRVWVRNSAANTAISFTVPFIAYLPTEHLGGSGLVAAVVAGIVTSQLAARRLTPEQRMSDTLNWRTIELMLEGAVFLLMGLELRDIVRENLASDEGLWHGMWLALAALGIVLVVRAAYVTFIVWNSKRRARRLDRERLEQFGERLDAYAAGAAPPEREGGARRRGRLPEDPEKREQMIGRARTRVSRALADTDYYQGSPLDWKQGAVIVWGGMRGVVTLAAAQTLPREEDRALLVFVAFLVAAVSLTLQGFTLPVLVRMLGLSGTSNEPAGAGSEELDDELRTAASSALLSGSLVDSEGRPFDAELMAGLGRRFAERPIENDRDATRTALELRLAIILAQRTRLEELTHDGRYPTAVLRHARAELDADQIGVQLRLDAAS
ncbi:cation:proton antiporter [Microbacterium sp. ASV49]|uniref:Sodium:proton antiporter n=1 Tax=Microbacterium candidum TaxID=3041922 RepID=A0ABT7MUU8_9MICO|nr:sodium:proton antiporter [Microbacterium sp. ASV49]MDL9978218.1 sodium:proton antiporter [Microbacterium sp. ASV49]